MNQLELVAHSRKPGFRYRHCPAGQLRVAGVDAVESWCVDEVNGDHALPRRGAARCAQVLEFENADARDRPYEPDADRLRNRRVADHPQEDWKDGGNPSPLPGHQAILQTLRPSRPSVT